ncbi:hypothetical protein [Salipiger abyssi]|uniref:hypothetical protein n=1 Tax=Salipiger abyssi TaxID=1250539 RepID=UPI001A8E638B|nr:hypothetical protein [Salipiger abyssi]MBN9886659.1 hypothetical protein [Salipiger abyssi]
MNELEARINEISRRGGSKEASSAVDVVAIKDELNGHAEALRAQLYTQNLPLLGRLEAVERAHDELLQHQDDIHDLLREADRRVRALRVWGVAILISTTLLSFLGFAAVLLIARGGLS